MLYPASSPTHVHLPLTSHGPDLLEVQIFVFHARPHSSNTNAANEMKYRRWRPCALHIPQRHDAHGREEIARSLPRMVIADQLTVMGSHASIGSVPSGPTNRSRTVHWPGVVMTMERVLSNCPSSARVNEVLQQYPGLSGTG